MAAKKSLAALQSSQPQGSGSGGKWLAAILGLSGIIVLLLVVLAFLGAGSSQHGNVALIKVSGHIGASDGLFGSSSDPDELVGMIGKAEESGRVKAILIEINSPGGSPVASEEVMKAVRNAKKPVVSVIRDIGTSGAYWVASASDYIVASPVSITGSVGVTASYLEFSQLLQKYGVRYERLVSAEHKDIGSPYRNLTAEEKEIAQESLAKMHEYFLSSVKENRKLTNAAAIEEVSTAIVFLGSEAKGLGLVDELGGKKEAEEWLKQQTNLTEISYVTYEKKPLFNIGGLLAEQSSVAGSAFGKSLVAQIISAATTATTASFENVKS